jgi:RNA polymerase sigma factor (sigma-70 family)
VAVVEQDWLAEQFESSRGHLRAVAYRMLGSLTEAEDAVQEAWLRLSRSDTSEVQNLGGWLTTVVGRVCLDMLRSRGSRREELLDGALPEPTAGDHRVDPVDPEREAVLADSVGLALLVVLETLEPAERLAFVLHDMFALPFDEIAPIVGRTPTAARQLASRARRRVQGGAAVPDPDLARQREVVNAFLAACRGGGFDALLAVLDPDVVLRIDASAVPAGATRLIRGAPAVARQALLFSRRARFTRPALVNGSVGMVVAPRGRLLLALGLTIADGKITEIDIIADPERLDRLDLAVLVD